MPPIRLREHEWTEFELHTMLCLIAKGVHLEQRPNKRTDAPSITRAKANENFYTALNNAVHGKDFSNDIHKSEVTRMLEQMLVDRKHVIGMGGLVERQRNGRVTRALRHAWKRYSALDFDGTESEWKQGRKERVMMQYKIERGIMKAPVEAPGENGDTTMAGVDDVTQDNLWEEARLVAVANIGRSRGRSETDQTSEGHSPNMVPVVQNTSLTMTNRDSFRVLPKNLRSSSKFGWATNPVPARDSYASSELPTNRQFKRAGLRTRDLSRSRGAETSGGTDKADRMTTPYMAYRSSATLRDGPVTPTNLNHRDRRSDHYTDSNSTPGFVDDSPTAMDMSPEVPTPISYASSHPRLQSSPELSPLRAFDESLGKDLDVGVEKGFCAELERDLAAELCQDVDVGDLEADLMAALGF